MKYIDADKLIAEIERLGRNWDGVQELQPVSLFQADLYELLAIIDSLQKEQPEVDLENEIEQYLDGFIKMPTREYFRKAIKYFYSRGLNARKEK